MVGEVDQWRNEARRTIWIYAATCCLEFALYIACLIQFAATRDVMPVVMMVGVAVFHLLYWERHGPWVIYRVLYKGNKQD